MQKYPAIFSMWRFVEDLGQSNQLSLLKPFTASFHPNTKTLYKTEGVNVGIRSQGHAVSGSHAVKL